MPRKAPYRHEDGSPCWTKDCKRNHARYRIHKEVIPARISQEQIKSGVEKITKLLVKDVRQPLQVLHEDVKSGSTEYEENDSQGSYESWTNRNQVLGNLALRVNNRFHLDSSTPVFITEESWESGDYTRDGGTSFKVEAGNKTIDFNPDTEGGWEPLKTDSITKKLFPSTDTVYARFHAWLRAGDNPSELQNEWLEQGKQGKHHEFGPKGSDGRPTVIYKDAVTYEVKPDTILWTEIRKRARYFNIKHIDIDIIDSDTGADVYVDTYAQMTADFVGLDQRAYFHIMNNTPADLMEELTDYYMVGKNNI